MKFKCFSQIKDGNKIIANADDYLSYYKGTLANLTTGATYLNFTNMNTLYCNCESLSDTSATLTTDDLRKKATEPHPFQKITNDMFETYSRKNHDYGNSFKESLDKFGLVASAVRLSDKMNRFSNLVDKDAQVAESLRDTLLDAATYCIMTVMWMDGNSKNV